MTENRIRTVGLVMVVIGITCWLGCGQHETKEERERRERQEAKQVHLQSTPPTRDPYLYTATITVNGGTCVQTVVRNGNTNLGDLPWVQLSQSNKDTITYTLGANTDSVTFPTNNGSPTLPGSPFGSYVILQARNSGPTNLTQEEDSDFYFQYSRVVYQGTPCAFPAQGMGVHVTQ